MKANCQLFFFTQLVRLYFVLPCTLSLTVFVRLYFVLQTQVFQLIPRQRLTQVVRLFFAVQFPIIQPLFYSSSLSLSSRIFQCSFSSFSIRFRLCRFSVLLFFTPLQLCGLFFIHNNTVLFSRFRSFLPKNIIFLFGKKGCKYRFRFVSQSNRFLLQTL